MDSDDTGTWPRRLGQWLGLVHEDGPRGHHGMAAGAPRQPRTGNAGPLPRRVGQWLGLVLNDDGTWGQHHLDIQRKPPRRGPH